AIKFTESGNIDILVEKRALSNTKVQIEVQIRDTGIGIPESNAYYCVLCGYCSCICWRFDTKGNF
ncbi:hybrid sensory histidine kinase BarA, partial [Salmonella enterica subsp. enterica serovar Enteritidis str. 50-5646]